MTPGLKWRIVTLQIVLIVALGSLAGFCFWGSNFTHSYVQNELTSQKISFPAANSASIKALPAADAQAMTQYAGQALDNGPKAETYADHFIAVHLNEIAGGKTYSQVSALSMASPTNTKLAGQVQTLFRGETLRGLLLNAWGWWTVGTYALYAGIALAVAAVVVLGALIFELFVAPARESAPAAAPGLRTSGARI
jgi:hypothetical protein